MNAVECMDGTILIGDGLLKKLKERFPDLLQIKKQEALTYLSTLNQIPNEFNK